MRRAFEYRLRELRRESNANAYKACNLALIVHSLWLAGLALNSMFFFFSFVTSTFSVGSYSDFDYLMLLEMIPMLLFLLLIALLIIRITTLRTLFPYYYRKAYSQYVLQGAGLLFAHEFYHVRLTEAIQRAQLIQTFKPFYKSIEQHLAFLATFIFPLQEIAWSHSNPSRSMTGMAINTYKLQWIFNASTQTCILVGLLVLVPVANYFVFFIEIAIIIVGSHYIISRAYLVAYLDWYLDEPRINPASLRTPQEPRGWWARQAAPWRFQEGHLISPATRYL